MPVIQPAPPSVATLRKKITLLPMKWKLPSWGEKALNYDPAASRLHGDATQTAHSLLRWEPRPPRSQGSPGAALPAEPRQHSGGSCERRAQGSAGARSSERLPASQRAAKRRRIATRPPALLGARGRYLRAPRPRGPRARWGCWGHSAICLAGESSRALLPMQPWGGGREAQRRGREEALMEPAAAGGQWGRGRGGGGASAGQRQPRQHLPGAVGKLRRGPAPGSSGDGRGRLREGRVRHASRGAGQEPGREPSVRPDPRRPPRVAPGAASSRRAAERIRRKTSGFSHGAPRAAAWRHGGGGVWGRRTCTAQRRRPPQVRAASRLRPLPAARDSRRAPPRPAEGAAAPRPPRAEPRWARRGSVSGDVARRDERFGLRAWSERKKGWFWVCWTTLPAVFTREFRPITAGEFWALCWQRRTALHRVMRVVSPLRSIPFGPAVGRYLPPPHGSICQVLRMKLRTRTFSINAVIHLLTFLALQKHNILHMILYKGNVF